MTFRPYRADLPWIQVAEDPGGGYVVVDTRTGERWTACCRSMVDSIAADRSGSTSHLGLGDVIHSVASFFGFERCSSCAQRQIAANRAIPKLWRKK